MGKPTIEVVAAEGLRSAYTVATEWNAYQNQFQTVIRYEDREPLIPTWETVIEGATPGQEMRMMPYGCDPIPTWTVPVGVDAQGEAVTVTFRDTDLRGDVAKEASVGAVKYFGAVREVEGALKIVVQAAEAEQI